MRLARRTLLIIGGVTLAALAAAYYWLIVESRMPSDARFELDVQQVRELAQAPGEKPTAIEVERVALFKFPATAVVAGDGWRSVEMPVYSYRVVYPNGAIVIDAALDEAIGGDELVEFDADAYGRMQAAIEHASAIVITHEHMDHVGGLTVHPQLASIAPRMKLTREQAAHPERSLPARFPQGALAQHEPLVYERYHALAPGLVLIKAPGHTPGSQMVYVQTMDGREYLFIGDVAWHQRNIDTQRERARLVTWLFLKEDRHAVFGQLATLKRLAQAEPRLRIIPGHDGEVVRELVAEGALTTPFNLLAR